MKLLNPKIVNSIIDYFTKGHIRSIEAKKNIVRLFAIKGVSIATNLALVPLTINYINPTQYGIWLTLSSILGWFSFFDIGFGNGLRNKFAEAKALGNLELARNYISTTYAAITVIFVVVWLIFYIINNYIDWSKILNAPPQMVHELSKLAIIVFSFFCVQMILKTINTVIIADQKPAKAAFFDMLGQLLALAIIVILIRVTHGSILYLGMALSISPITVLILSSFWFYSRQYKKVTPSFRYMNFTYAKDILGIGLKFFFLQISAIVIFQTINLVIAQIGSPKDVTIFNIAYKYMTISIMAFTIITTPFWSAITDAFTIRDYLWMKSIVKKLRIVTLFMIIAVMVLFFVSNFGYSFWIGDSIKIPLSVTAITGFYAILLCWASLNATILNGTGKITIQLITHLAGTIFHLPLAFLLGKRFGLEGVISSACIFCLIIAVFSNIQVNKILNQKANGLWER